MEYAGNKVAYIIHSMVVFLERCITAGTFPAVQTKFTDTVTAIFTDTQTTFFQSGTSLTDTVQHLIFSRPYMILTMTLDNLDKTGGRRINHDLADIPAVDQLT